MEDIYFKQIQDLYKQLRKTLVTAICRYLEEGAEIKRHVKSGNEMLTYVEPSFNSRGHVVPSETILFFKDPDDEACILDPKPISLDKVSADWLIITYETLSSKTIEKL